MTVRRFDDVLALRPDLNEPYRDFLGLFWDRRLIDPAVLDRCRSKVVHMLGGSADDPRADGNTDAALDAALTFAEQFVIDPHGVTDSHRADVRAHYSEPELVALVESLALFDGFTRFRRAWCADDVEREPFRPPRAPTAILVPPDDADPALSGSVLGQQPETLTAFLRLYGTLWSHGTVPQPLKEVARLRNARITDCGY